MDWTIGNPHWTIVGQWIAQWGPGIAQSIEQWIEQSAGGIGQWGAPINKGVNCKQGATRKGHWTIDSADCPIDWTIDCPIAELD